MMLRKPTCSDCPHNLQYMERLPIKKKGVTMHLGTVSVAHDQLVPLSRQLYDGLRRNLYLF